MLCSHGFVVTVLSSRLLPLCPCGFVLAAAPSRSSRYRRRPPAGSEGRPRSLGIVASASASASRLRPRSVGLAASAPASDRHRGLAFAPSASRHGESEATDVNASVTTSNSGQRASRRRAPRTTTSICVSVEIVSVALRILADERFALATWNPALPKSANCWCGTRGSLSLSIDESTPPHQHDSPGSLMVR